MIDKQQNISLDLPERVRRNFRRRYRQLQFIQIAGATTLLLAGAWMFLPWLAGLLSQIILPQPGVPFLRTLASLLDTNKAAIFTVQNAAFMQTNLNSSVNLVDGFGLLAMAFGAALGMHLLLSRRSI